MSTLEATISMLEVMPEEARQMVYKYTKGLFTARKPANPFVPLTTDQILSDLEESRHQVDAGLAIDMDKALEDIGKRNGFL